VININTITWNYLFSNFSKSCSMEKTNLSVWTNCEFWKTKWNKYHNEFSANFYFDNISKISKTKIWNDLIFENKGKESFLFLFFCSKIETSQEWFWNVFWNNTERKSLQFGVSKGILFKLWMIQFHATNVMYDSIRKIQETKWRLVLNQCYWTFMYTDIFQETV